MVRSWITVLFRTAARFSFCSKWWERQSVFGFFVGQNDTFKARVYARASTAAAQVRVTVGSTVIVPNTAITPVGTGNPFYTISQSFQSPGSGSYNVTIENTQGGVDNSLLVDMVEIVLTPTSARDWSLYE